MRITILLAGLLAFGQDAGKIVTIDDFESELSGWTALKIDDGAGLVPDEESKVAHIRDGQNTRLGRGALSYVYDLNPAALRVLSLQRPKDFTGTESLRFWLKSACATSFTASLVETGGAVYQAPFYSPAGTWQEIVLNLDELLPDDASKDRNGKLDLDEIESIRLQDAGCFLVRLLPDLKGPRLLWLDDVVLSSKPAPRTTGPTKSIHLVDSFESPLIRWTPVSIEVGGTPRINVFDSAISIDSDAPGGGGKQSLRISYVREAMKIQAFLRNLEKADLRKATALELSLRTSRDGTFVLGIEEKDGSRYNQLLELKAGDGWKAFSHRLDGFGLAQDSQDENKVLDAGQIKEISLIDLSPMIAGSTGETVVRVDQVRFALAP